MRGLVGGAKKRAFDRGKVEGSWGGGCRLGQKNPTTIIRRRAIILADRQRAATQPFGWV